MQGDLSYRLYRDGEILARTSKLNMEEKNDRFLYLKLGKDKWLKLDIVDMFHDCHKLSKSEVRRLLAQNAFVVYAPKGSRWSDNVD